MNSGGEEFLSHHDGFVHVITAVRPRYLILSQQRKKPRTDAVWVNIQFLSDFPRRYGVNPFPLDMRVSYHEWSDRLRTLSKLEETPHHLRSVNSGAVFFKGLNVFPHLLQYFSSVG